jgi:hypothetical protein
MENPITLKEVITGEEFSLNDDGTFSFTLVEFHNFLKRPSAVDVGQEVVMIVFTDDMGIKQELRADTPVWVTKPHHSRR